MTKILKTYGFLLLLAAFAMAGCKKMDVTPEQSEAQFELKKGDWVDASGEDGEISHDEADRTNFKPRKGEGDPIDIDNVNDDDDEEEDDEQQAKRSTQ